MFSKSTENNFSIALMLVRHRAALNYVLAQWMNIILQQDTSQFLLQPAYMTWCFEVTFFIIGSSELRITVHHNNRFNCLRNGISPPSCLPDLEPLALMATWRVQTSFVPNWIASGHNNKNIVKTDLSKNGSSEFHTIFSTNREQLFHSTDASPPSCRPDLVLLPLIDIWRDRSSFVLKCISSGYNNTNIVKTDFSKTARQNFKLFSQPMEHNFSISLILVRYRAALNYVLAQWMNIILQQETLQFLSQAAYMTWCFEVTFFIIGSSELRIALHHNSRLNCLSNGISPPTCRPDLDLLPTNGHLKR